MIHHGISLHPSPYTDPTPAFHYSYDTDSGRRIHTPTPFRPQNLPSWLGYGPTHLDNKLRYPRYSTTPPFTNPSDRNMSCGTHNTQSSGCRLSDYFIVPSVNELSYYTPGTGIPPVGHTSIGSHFAYYFRDHSPAYPVDPITARRVRVEKPSLQDIGSLQRDQSSFQKDPLFFHPKSSYKIPVRKRRSQTLSMFRSTKPERGHFMGKIKPRYHSE